jgi:adenine-specific DNA-methyltransferase
VPTLNWIGKDAVVRHHKEVPFRLLEADKKLSHGDPAAGNLIVEGDNLHALKALLPRYAGKVKCICIDPPYNTGDKGWIYSDNVNSLEITRWLDSVVGKEGEDLSRHDKWLCMMYPRLTLLKQFLTEDGVIFVSMDETEIGNLRLLMDEIFGKNNALGSLVWKRRSSSAMSGTPLSIDHEYVLTYARNSERIILHGLEKGIESYPLVDERGHFASTDLSIGMGKAARPNQFFDITNPRTGRNYSANPERVWRFFPDTMEQVIADGLIIWPDDYPDRKMERPRYKTYFDPNTDKPKPVSSWIETTANLKGAEEDGDEWGVSILSTGMNQEGGRILQDIFGTKSFDYPKPVSLFNSLVRMATKDEDFILDSFGGSGTTAHAVLKQNAADGGKRKFILVEMEPGICRDITAERVRRVAGGYTNAKGEAVEGLGGGFQYCRLSKEPLFDATGAVRDDVRFAQLAEFVWFAETGTGFGRKANSPLLGVHEGVGVYLLYNGILKDKSADGGNVLTAPVLAMLPPHDGPKVIYAAASRLGAPRLQRDRIVFKQTPYALDL